MIDHIVLGVKNVETARAFYDAALDTLGYKNVYEEKGESGRTVAIGYGTEKAVFWICLPHDESIPAQACNGTHIAFKAENKEQVHAFHKAAMKNGATEDSPPGPCPEYHENYYAAYVYDPDGHKIEVVFGNE